MSVPAGPVVEVDVVRRRWGHYALVGVCSNGLRWDISGAYLTRLGARCAARRFLASQGPPDVVETIR